MQIFLFILGFILFVSLVLIHEYGHYLAARRNGVKAEEFGLGFPPRALGKKLKSGMILSLNWLPLGGFVRLKGEHDSASGKGSFGAASLGAKSKIMLAGVTMNLLAGLLLLTILAVVGMPKLLTKANVGQEQFTVASDTRISHQEVRAGFITAGSPAKQAGLDNMDIIKRISTGQQSRDIKTAANLREATSAFAGQTVALELERRGKPQTKTISLLSREEVESSRKSGNPKGYLGIVPNEIIIQKSTWSAPIVALGFTKQLVELTFKGLGQALGGLGSTIAGAVTGNTEARQNGQTQATEQVGGPVAIMAVLWGGGDLGIYFMLMVIAILSLTLAIINVLPIPALDGGRLFVTLFYRLIKRPLTRATEQRIHGTGMTVLLALIALITIVDVKRFF